MKQILLNSRGPPTGKFVSDRDCETPSIAVLPAAFGTFVHCLLLYRNISALPAVRATSQRPHRNLVRRQLARSGPSRVKSVDFAMSATSPLHPQYRTFASGARGSVSCQYA